MLGCFPCLKWLKIRSDDVDPERQPLFPPPDTVITRPPALAHLPRYGSNDHSSSSNSPHLSPPPTASRSHRGSGASERRRERIGSISRAAQSCMRPVVQPNSRSSSVAPTPVPSRISFFEPPHRRAAPNLGRSISEPRSLIALAANASNAADTSPKPDFAPHQLPPATTSGLRGRPRSATAIDRLSTLHSSRDSSSGDPRHVTGAAGDGDRGRSPGPSRLGRSSSAGLISALIHAQISESSEGTGLGHGENVTEATARNIGGAGENGPRAVTQLQLGLQDLMSQGTVRRGQRGRAVKPRARATR